jgi:hypothetical protein
MAVFSKSTIGVHMYIFSRLSKSLSWLLRHHLDLAVDVMSPDREIREDARYDRS